MTTSETPSTSSGQAATGEGARATGQAASLPNGGAGYCRTDLRTRFGGVSQEVGILTDDIVRLMLGDCCQFLWQLAQLTSGVVETLGIGNVRQIVAAELPVPRHIIREDGTASDGAAPTLAEPDRDPSSASGRDHRKNPRGRRHPVITLLQMTLQGIRLLMQISAGTNPNAHNEETLEQKKTREELKEQERTFKNLLSGKV